MPKQAKIYVTMVIGSGAAVLAASLAHASVRQPFALSVYLLFAMAGSLVKLRLPGIAGNYSLNFLFLLFGVLHFSLFETILAACLASLVQSLVNVSKKPTWVQVLFNIANLILSIALCFLVIRVLSPVGLSASRPAQMGLAAFLFFVTNTVLVSGILALLQGRRLHETCTEWYVWYLPYYLIGAVLVGMFPDGGRVLRVEAWMVLLPLLYLLHFFLGLLRLHPPAAVVSLKPSGSLSVAAKLYLVAVISAGAVLVVASVEHWHTDSLARFATYLLLAAAAATLKVRLPGMRGTLSLAFVLVLVAIVELTLAESVILSALVGLIQCLWKAKRHPIAIQVIFNAASLALSTTVAYSVCHWIQGTPVGQPLTGMLAVASLTHYACNTLFVAIVLCLVEERSLRKLWQNCHFWSCPYYLVGAAAAGLMIMITQAAGWQVSLSVPPMMLLVYISYRIHVARASSAAWSS